MLTLLVNLLVLEVTHVVADVVDSAGKDVGIIGMSDMLLGVVDGTV